MEMTHLDRTIKSWLAELKHTVGEHEKLTYQTKRDRRDLVTQVDWAVEEYLCHKIQGLGLPSQIIGEETYQEGQGIDSKSEHLWLVDPIDGTANFVKTRANFAVMLAYFYRGQPTLAYIYDLAQDCLYWARAGYGVYCNEHRLDWVDNLTLAEGLIHLPPRQCGSSPYYQRVVNQAFDLRHYGCSSMDGLAVLKGQAAAFINPACGPWDFAPFILMAEELGLHFSRFDGSQPALNQRSNFVLATPAAWQELKGMLL